MNIDRCKELAENYRNLLEYRALSDEGMRFQEEIINASEIVVNALNEYLPGSPGNPSSVRETNECIYKRVDIAEYPWCVLVTTPRGRYEICFGEVVCVEGNRLVLEKIFLYEGNFRALNSMFRRLFMGDEYATPLLCKFSLCPDEESETQYIQDVKEALARPETHDAERAYQCKMTLKELRWCYYPSYPQEEAIEAINNAYEMEEVSGLVALPTGVGKTFVSAQIALSIQSPSIIFMAHRVELLKQAIAAYRKLQVIGEEEVVGINFDITEEMIRQDKRLKLVNSVEPFSQRVVFTTDVSLKKYDESVLHLYDLFVVDEAHRYYTKTPDFIEREKKLAKDQAEKRKSEIDKKSKTSKKKITPEQKERLKNNKNNIDKALKRTLEKIEGQSLATEWIKYAKNEGNTFVLGLTATPFRTDGQSVVKLFNENGYPSYNYTVTQAIWSGFLSQVNYFVADDLTNPVTGVDLDHYKELKDKLKEYDEESRSQAVNVKKAIETFKASIRYDTSKRPEDQRKSYCDRAKRVLYHFKKLAKHKKAIGFCQFIDEAKYYSELFKDHGIAAEWISGQDPDRYRKLDSFRSNIPYYDNGRCIQVMFSSDLLNEGVDIPDLDSVLLIRNTDSPVKMFQQLGRGLRLYPGKKSCTVIDFASTHIDFEKAISLGVSNLIGERSGSIQYFKSIDKRSASPMAIEALEEYYQIVNNGVKPESFEYIMRLISTSSKSHRNAVIDEAISEAVKSKLLYPYDALRAANKMKREYGVTNISQAQVDRRMEELEIGPEDITLDHFAAEIFSQQQYYEERQQSNKAEEKLGLKLRDFEPKDWDSWLTGYENFDSLLYDENGNLEKHFVDRLGLPFHNKNEGDKNTARGRFLGIWREYMPTEEKGKELQKIVYDFIDRYRGTL